MRCHIGVDSGSGLVHTITATAANAHDITEAHKLLREDDHVVYGDSGWYIGIEKRDEIKNSEHFRKIDFRINRRPKVCRKYLIMRLTGNVILKTENPLHSFVACVPSSIIQDHIDECAKSMTNMIYRICFPCYSRQQHN